MTNRPHTFALCIAAAVFVLGAWTYASGQRVSPARARPIPEAAAGDSGAGTEAPEAGPAAVKGVRLAYLDRSHAHAAPNAAGYDESVRELAVMCTAEIDLQADPWECDRMWSVHRRKGPDVIAHIRRYVSILRRDRFGRWLINTPRARWVRALRLDGAMPAGWPSTLAWDRGGPARPSHRTKWLRMLQAARTWLAAPAVTCEADQYGGRCEDPGGACDRVPACWRRVDCSGPHGERSAQAYYDTSGCKGRTLPASVAAGGRW